MADTLGLFGFSEKPVRFAGNAGACEQAAATVAEICARFEGYYGEECRWGNRAARADIVRHLRHARAALDDVETTMAEMTDWPDVVAAANAAGNGPVGGTD